MKGQKSACFTHLDKQGRAQMVDVGDKPVTRREATATGTLYVGEKIFPLLVTGRLPKGEAYATARIAAIMAVKNTAHLIPLCHPLPVTGIDVDFIPEPEKQAIAIRVRVWTQARTGVEMEALVGVAAAALTLYDMCKAIDRNMVIGPIMLVEKHGGKSGDYQRYPVPVEDI